VRAAEPRLRVLAAEDQREVEHWWPVATEAEWALRVLAGDPDAEDVLPKP
jgi:hypothetical protein